MTRREIYGGTLCETLIRQAFEQDRAIRNKIQLVSKTGIFKEADLDIMTQDTTG